jgi:hypothetical protein
VPDKDKAGTKHYDPEKHVVTDTPGDDEAGNEVQNEPEAPGVGKSDDDDSGPDSGLDPDSEDFGADGYDKDAEEQDDDCDSPEKDGDEDS